MTPSDYVPSDPGQSNGSVAGSAPSAKEPTSLNPSVTAQRYSGQIVESHPLSTTSSVNTEIAESLPGASGVFFCVAKVERRVSKTVFTTRVTRF